MKFWVIMCTIERINITHNNILERANSRAHYTPLGDGKMRAFILYPTELIWSWVWRGGKFNALNKVLGNNILFTPVVEDNSSQFILDLTIMGKHRCSRGVGFIRNYEDEIGVQFSRIVERKIYRRRWWIWMIDLSKNILVVANIFKCSTIDKSMQFGLMEGTLGVLWGVEDETHVTLEGTTWEDHI